MLSCGKQNPDGINDPWTWGSVKGLSLNGNRDHRFEAMGLERFGLTYLS